MPAPYLYALGTQSVHYRCDKIYDSLETMVREAKDIDAVAVFSGAPDVFSTPSLGALVEATAAGWLARQLEAGQISVGTQLVINHTAATPPGLAVTAEVKVVAIDGRRVDFDWTARDDREQVGHGTHQRFVVDAARFMAGVEKKLQG